jgi:small-conductance mechanosensitive channel
MLNTIISGSVIVVSTIILLVAEHYIIKKLSSTKQWKYWQFFLFKAFDRPLKSIIALTGIIYLVEFLYLSKNSFFTSENFDTAKLIVLIISLTLGMLSFVKRLEKYFLKTNSLSRHNEKERYRSTIILLMKLFFVTSLMVGILMVLHTLGVRMQAVITVISLSGVAIGISSRDLVASFFGTIFIYTNGPFSIGDKIKVGNFEGLVENVTWLSTRLRLDNKNLMYIPNIQFLNATVENMSYALQKRVNLFLTIFHYDTKEVKYIVNKIVDSIKQTKIESEEGKYNPKSSYDIMSIDEHKLEFKIKIYFNKYITKQELILQKLNISDLISDTFKSRNIRFKLNIDE